MTDAEMCLRWVTDPDVLRYLGLTQPASTIDAERAWISRMLTDGTHHRIFVIEIEDARPIGTCGLREIDRETGSATLGIMIGEKRLWDRGYGTAATKALLAHAFTELGLTRVELSCHRDNGRGLRCYEKAGFVPAGSGSAPRPYGGTKAQMVIDRQRWEELSRGEGGEGRTRRAPSHGSTE